MVAMRDECNSEVGNVVRGDVEEGSGSNAVKISLMPGERARVNLAFLYSGPGRTFQPWAVTGAAERRAAFSEG